MQSAIVLRARLFCANLVFTICFVDQDGVSNFHNAFFNALQLVACAWHQQQQEKIHHRAHGDFALPGAYGFYQNHIVARGFTHQDRFSRFAGHTAQHAASGRRPYKSSLFPR